MQRKSFLLRQAVILAFSFVVLFLMCFCMPAYAAETDDLDIPDDEVFILEDEPVPLADSIWGSEPATVYITHEFYRGVNTVSVPMKYFDAIEGSTKSLHDQAIDAFWEAERQSCYLFGDVAVGVSVGGNSVSITRDSYFEPDEEQRMRSTVEVEADRIIANIITDGMSEYQKAYAIYQYVSQSAYDWTAYNAITGGECNKNADKWAKATSAYGNLIERKSVCQGDAQAFNLLARKAGLTSMTATGKMKNGGGHAWNRVWCNSQWYEVDCCFGHFCPTFASYSASTGVTYGGVGIMESSASRFYGV